MNIRNIIAVNIIIRLTSASKSLEPGAKISFYTMEPTHIMWQRIVIYLKLSIVMEYIMFKIRQCNNKIDKDHPNYSLCYFLSNKILFK